MMHTFQLAIIVIAIPLIAVFLYADSKGVPMTQVFVPGYPVLHIDEKPFRVEIVSTPEDREKGLSGRAEIGDVQGMLFVFDEAKYHGIWMKGMRFPIDIIWIGEDRTIVGINEHVRPESYPRIYEPPKPARYVLETESFFVETFSIKVGQQVRLPVELTRQRFK